MKKSVLKWLAGLACSALVLGLSACNEMHVHRYAQAVTAPTCTEQGYTTYTCRCGESYVDNYVEALGHEFTDYVFNNDATYDSDGTKTAACNHAGCLVTDTIPVENTQLMEKIIILDASASMRAKVDEITRFERAVEKISEFSREFFQENGTISLIFADDSPEFIAERSSAAEQEAFFSKLDALSLYRGEKCSYGSADMKSAMTLAESILKQNANAEIMLYTGTTYQTDSDVELVNVADGEEWNAAILDANTTIIEGYYMLAVDVACYGRDQILQLNIDINGVNQVDQCLHFETEVSCPQDQEMKVVFINEDFYDEQFINQENTIYYLLNNNERLYSYESIFVSINEADSFDCDNFMCLYGGQKQVLKTQCTSANPNAFLVEALLTVQHSLQDYWDINIVETRFDCEPELEGYDFYIFENKDVAALPSDGAIFLINPTSSKEGFSLGESISGNFTLSFDDTHAVTKGLQSASVAISSYKKIASYDSSFMPIMWCGNDPVCLVKNTPTEKIIVLTCELQSSSLNVALPLLMNNIFNYFFPKTIEKNIFEVGEEITIKARGEEVKMVQGGDAEMTFTQFPATFLPSVPGTYTFSQECMSGQQAVERIFVKIPKIESNLFRTEILPQPNQIIVSVTVQEEEKTDIVKVESVKNRIEIGKTTPLKIFVNSTFEGETTLTLYNNQKAEKSVGIELVNGSQMFELDYVFDAYGLHELTFDIVKADGTSLSQKGCVRQYYFNRGAFHFIKQIIQ